MRPGKHLSCISCHDPHSAESGELFAYNKKKSLNCASCATQNNDKVFCDILIETMQIKKPIEEFHGGRASGALVSSCSIIAGKDDIILNRRFPSDFWKR